MGECEVFVCLGFVEIISFLYFLPLGAKLIALQTGCQFFKKTSIFFGQPSPQDFWKGSY